MKTKRKSQLQKIKLKDSGDIIYNWSWNYRNDDFNDNTWLVYKVLLQFPFPIKGWPK